MLPMPSTTLLVLVHAAATLFMTGLVWFVQVVHYPLYDRVGADGFSRYELDHTRRTGWVVGPAMAVEAGSAAWLLAAPPTGVPVALLWLGAALLALVWLSTFFLQVPRHGELCYGFDAGAHRALVRSNWVRTWLWSARSLVAIAVADLAQPLR